MSVCGYLAETKCWNLVPSQLILSSVPEEKCADLIREIQLNAESCECYFYIPKVPNPSKIVQSAFVQGRRIAYNIFLFQELFRGYHINSKSPKYALKVDITKAYDKVRWDFLFDILSDMKFPNQLIKWIRACVSTPSFSINTNGELNGYFNGAKRLTQGNPLSTYLFVIAMEALVWCLREALKEFEDPSGLSPSLNISHVSFSGVEGRVKNEILNLLVFREGKLPVRYIGMPLITTKLRVQLINSIIFSMQVYWASTFILPKRVSKEINNIHRNFLWCGVKLKHTGAKVSWEDVSLPRNEGGLGIKDVAIWNKTFRFSSGGEESVLSSMDEMIPS
ncbi:hypothetical protein Acr_17g0005740 [Actinidia rufa]|uniref:Reverse transcriptase domain-containing protein n=1 Tax=Actinidia rufa TaxID=165716 RepID=A0A7J0G2J8_9ERIC|nr:hypothetical protein Acr_17g0005740 [Actinidia rufa]